MTRITYISEPQVFWNAYYQRGYGMQVYSDVPLQRGTGIGSFFKGLFRLAWPVLKKAGKTVASESLRSAADLTGDVLRGDDWKKAAKKRALEGSNKVLKKAVNKMQTGDGVGARPKTKSKSIKRITNGKNKDRFPL